MWVKLVVIVVIVVAVAYVRAYSTVISAIRKAGK